MATVLKTVKTGDSLRGFESHALRSVMSQDIEDTVPELARTSAHHGCWASMKPRLGVARTAWPATRPGLGLHRTVAAVSERTTGWPAVSLCEMAEGPRKDGALIVGHHRQTPDSPPNYARFAHFCLGLFGDCGPPAAESAASGPQSPPPSAVMSQDVADTVNPHLGVLCEVVLPGQPGGLPVGW